MGTCKNLCHVASCKAQFQTHLEQSQGKEYPNHYTSSLVKSALEKAGPTVVALPVVQLNAQMITHLESIWRAHMFSCSYGERIGQMDGKQKNPLLAANTVLTSPLMAINHLLLSPENLTF